MVFDNQLAVTPGGKPVAVPIPVAPVVECVIFGDTAVLIHKVGEDDAAPTVLLGNTVISAEVTATVQEFPVVVTVYGNDPVTVGVPLIVNVVPEMDEVTPVGKPETVAPVAPPPNVIVIFVIAVFIQTVRFAAAVMV